MSWAEMALVLMPLVVVCAFCAGYNVADAKHEREWIKHWIETGKGR
jgi:hypothetical protein